MGRNRHAGQSRGTTPDVAFSGDRFFLSNFYPHPFLFNGHTYPTAEHAFQAAKCVDQSEAECVRQAPSPAAAKQIGRRVRLRADWDEARVDAMRGVLAAKFSDPDLRARLLATGKTELVEENTWGDRFWGRFRGAGRNMLGQLHGAARLAPGRYLRFYLGAHHPRWLERAVFPLFVSHRRLAARHRLPRAATGWALDSGGFTELRLHSGWRTTAAESVVAVR